MRVDKRKLLSNVIYARSIRHRIALSSFTPKADFYCFKCGRRQPFGGDLAIQFYGNPGVTLYCNDCLGEFEEKLRTELDWDTDEPFVA